MENEPISLWSAVWYVYRPDILTEIPYVEGVNLDHIILEWNTFF